MKAIVIVLLLPLLLCGCKSDKNNPAEPGLEEDEKEIVALYYQWAGYSESHNYSGMLALTYPGSNFEGRTNVCKSSWDEGDELYYTINSVKVLYWDEEGPYVVGNIHMYQGNGDPDFYNGFASGCRKQNDKWKLDGINSNSQPDWWR